MTSLNFHHLRHFATVAREGSVSRAAKRLHVTQPTVSEQLRLLAEELGEELFVREGRNLVLTDVGKTVAHLADEIFALGDRLVAAARGKAERPLRLAAGISDGVPKPIALRILEPAFAARAHVTVREAAPPQLLADLASQLIDVVISDAPSHDAGTRAHLLGDSPVGIWGTKRLASELRVGFPRSLDGAPFLMPALSTGFRRELDAWFIANKITPAIAGELDDDALLAAAAERGHGLYAAPDLAFTGRRGLVRAGSVKPLRARYYAITSDRKTTPPAVALLLNTSSRWA